jgi:hypothetical protein
MPSVMQTMTLMPAAAASKMASAAKAGGTKIREVLAPVSAAAWATVLNTGTSSSVLAALARGDPGHQLGAVVATGPGVERALLAGDPLDHHAGVMVYQNAHNYPSITRFLPEKRNCWPFSAVKPRTRRSANLR